MKKKIRRYGDGGSGLGTAVGEQEHILDRGTPHESRGGGGSGWVQVRLGYWLGPASLTQHPPPPWRRGGVVIAFSNPLVLDGATIRGLRSREPRDAEVRIPDGRKTGGWQRDEKQNPLSLPSPTTVLTLRSECRMPCGRWWLCRLGDR